MYVWARVVKFLCRLWNDSENKLVKPSSNSALKFCYRNLYLNKAFINPFMNKLKICWLKYKLQDKTHLFPETLVSVLVCFLEKGSDNSAFRQYFFLFFFVLCNRILPLFFVLRCNELFFFYKAQKCSTLK